VPIRVLAIPPEIRAASGQFSVSDRPQPSAEDVVDRQLDSHPDWQVDTKSDLSVRWPHPNQRKRWRCRQPWMVPNLQNDWTSHAEEIRRARWPHLRNADAYVRVVERSQVLDIV